MRFSTLTGAFALGFSLTTAAPTVYTAEFTALGCPKSTSPVATEEQQYAVMADFTSLLYEDKKATEAFNKYVALHVINHASEVPGDGRELALKTVGPLLASSTVSIKQMTVGQDHSTTFFKGTTSKGSVAAVDMFRMSGTCLVEHWVLQAPITNSSNPHPWF